MGETTAGSLERPTPQSWRVSASKPVSYEVRVHRSLLAPDDPSLAHALVGVGGTDPGDRSTRRLVVVDRVIDDLHGPAIEAYFDAHGIALAKAVVDAGEARKDWTAVERVLEAMDRFRIDRRREPVVAIGGGVLCDVVGFAASLYRRGTPYLKIPTSLIGLVDAGVGIKTGVNHGGGKNRIGTYAHADVTLLDVDFLATLPDRHLGNGMAEILKVALVKSPRLFARIEDAAAIGLRDVFTAATWEPLAAEIVEGAVHAMLEELQPNLWESCLERCVDYGHTLSPTIEMRALPELLHGEAVAVDMAVTTGISVHRGLMTPEEGLRVIDVTRRLGIEPWTDLLEDRGLLVEAIADATRHRDGLQRIPLTRGIGAHVFVNDIGEADVEAGVGFVREASRIARIGAAR